MAKKKKVTDQASPAPLSVPRFEARTGLLLFHDCQPGSTATMRGPDGAALAPRGEHNSFDDASKQYTWAFDATGVEWIDGAQVVFTTDDRSVIGAFQAGAFQIVKAAG